MLENEIGSRVETFHFEQNLHLNTLNPTIPFSSSNPIRSNTAPSNLPDQPKEKINYSTPFFLYFPENSPSKPQYNYNLSLPYLPSPFPTS